jgi:hypothetical protein
MPVMQPPTGPIEITDPAAHRCQHRQAAGTVAAVAVLGGYRFLQVVPAGHALKSLHSRPFAGTSGDNEIPHRNISC